MNSIKKAFFTTVPIAMWLTLVGIAGGIEQNSIELYPGMLWMAIVLLASMLILAYRPKNI